MPARPRNAALVRARAAAEVRSFPTATVRHFFRLPVERYDIPMPGDADATHDLLFYDGYCAL
ncbi:MAG: hypothetical protein ACOC1G_00105, partial [Phycisphaeraceae bacterium]